MIHRLARRLVSLERLRHRADRGATLVEYALLLALFVVVSLAAIQNLQTSTSERFVDTSEDAGAPAEINGFYGQRDQAPSGGGPGSTLPDPGPTLLASISLGGGVATPANGSNWDGSVTVTALDSGGNPLAGVAVELGWTVHNSSGSVPLVTGADGTVVYTRSGIGQNRTLTFTVTNVVADGYAFETPYPTVSLTKDGQVTP